MSRPSPSRYSVDDPTFTNNSPQGRARNSQLNWSETTNILGTLQPSTIRPEPFALLPRQFSYPSGHIGADRGANESANGFSYIAGEELRDSQSLDDGLSYLERIDRSGAEGEVVPQRHVDIFSDGVYLNTALQDSFIGISLSPSVGPTTLSRSRVSVQLDGPPSQSDVSLIPGYLPRKHNSSLILGVSNVRNHVSQLPSQPSSNAELDPYQPAGQHQPRGLKTLSATLPGTAYEIGASRSLETAGRPAKGSSKTTIRTYSSLRKSRDKSPAHDFAVTVVERESSGESTDYGEPMNDEGASIQSGEHSIAAKAANIIRDWKIDSYAQEHQRLSWEAYGKHELENGPACYKTAWRKDLLLRDCQHQIQSKLRSK